LITRIFEISPDQYSIVFDHALQDAKVVADEFANSIRFIALNAQLSNELPKSFVREITPLTDADAAGSVVGLPMNMGAFDSLLLSRFHDLPIVGLREAASTIYVMTERPISAEAKEKITEFIREIRLPISLDFEIGTPAEP
jgi:hypothetical protein